MRRLSTRELRAERDRLAQLRAQCPPDRSRELRLATRRAAEAEQARQQARTDHQAAAEQVAALAGSWRRRRDLAAARERLVLAEHALRTTTGQADQAAERLGVLRRAQQRHLGWMEAHDAELRVQERAVAREDAWRRRVDQRALALDPPGWLLAELGPVPTDPQERAVWRVAAAELDGYRRAYGLDHPGPAKHRWGQGGPGRAGRLRRPPRLAGERADGARGQRERRGRGERAHRRGDRGQRPTVAADRRHRVDPEPAAGRRTPPRRPPAAAATGRPPGPRWSGWPAGTATATTATSRIPTATGPAAAWTATLAARNATAASWQKGAAHAPAPRPRPTYEDEDLEELGTPVYQGDGLSVRELTAEELQRFLDAHAGQPAQRLGSGWAALDPPGHPHGVPRTPPGRPAPGPQPAVPAEPVTGSLGSPGRSALAAVPAPPRARAGRLDPQPGLAGAAGRRRRRRRPASSPPRPACHGPGWSAWPSPRWSAGGCGFAPPSRPAPGSAAPQGSGAPPACWTASPATATWSSTTWPCPARRPTSTTW